MFNAPGKGTYGLLGLGKALLHPPEGLGKAGHMSVCLLGKGSDVGAALAKAPQGVADVAAAGAEGIGGDGGHCANGGRGDLGHPVNDRIKAPSYAYVVGKATAKCKDNFTFVGDGDTLGGDPLPDLGEMVGHSVPPPISAAARALQLSA